MTAAAREVLRIVFAAAESHPWVKTGGLGDVMGALPPALHERGHEVVAILPLYDAVDREEAGLSLLATIDVRFLGNDFPTRIFEAPYPRSECRALFVENQYYFERHGVYDDPETGRPYPDDDERWIFFQLAVLELLRQTGMGPDLLVCSDWQTALLPALLRIKLSEDRLLQKTRSVLAVHNLGYQGVLPVEALVKAGLPRELHFPLSPFEFYGQLNCMKAGLAFADEVVTVSPSYAAEIALPEHGQGLDGVIRQHGDRVTGILNGIDQALWDPAGPVLGMVTRLTGQKGLNSLAGCLDRLLQGEVRLVILGSGEKQFEKFLADVAERSPERMAIRIGYDEGLSHLVYAGADAYLMPSRYEPCGLSQMYAMRYGTLPIVHATGGLKDTVTPFLVDADRATGFAFSEYHAEALLEAVDVALSAWRLPRTWRRLQKNAMKQDFSWEQSAARYEELFAAVRRRPRWGA